MNVAPTPIERPHGVGIDPLSDDQRERIRQAETAVLSLKRCGLVSHCGADRNRLASVYKISGGRQRLASHSSGADQNLRPRDGSKHKLVIARAGERVHRRSVMCIIDRERGYRNAGIENDQLRHSARSSLR